MFRAILIAGAILTIWAGWPIPARAQQDTTDKIKSVQDIAGQLYREGNYEQALIFGEQALELLVEKYGADHEQIAIATYGLGLTADRAGNDKKAAEYYGQTVKVREIVYGPESPGLAEALDLYGRALMRLKRVDEAAQLFQRSLKIRKDIMGFEHAYQAGSISNLAAVAVARRQYAEAVHLYRKAISLLDAQKTDFVYANKKLSQGLKKQRATFIGLANAVWNGQQQLGVSPIAAFNESFSASQEAWRTSAAEAIARMTARLGAADTPLGRDVSRLQKMADEIISLNEEDMRELARWSAVQRQNPAYVAAQQAVQQESNKAFKGDKLEKIRQQRAVSQERQDLIKRCPPGQPKPGCEGSVDKIKQMGAELREMVKADTQDRKPMLDLIEKMNAIDKTLPGYDAFQKARQIRIARSSELGIERRALRKKIVESYPAYAAMADPQPLDAARVQALLTDDEALAAMLVGREKSYIWVVTRETAAWGEIDAGERQLAAEVKALRDGLDPLARLRDPDAITSFDFERAHQLYKTLFASIAPHIAGKKHLILVPNGPLTSLPPQVLITKPVPLELTAKEAAQQASWLIRSHALSVLPSVQSLEALRRLQQSTRQRRPFLGVGDPVLKGPGNAAGSSRGVKVAQHRPQQFYTRGLADVRAVSAMTPLPDTADELRAIARVVGAPASDILLQNAASEPAVRAKDLASYRIVHFATHGLVAGELSGLTEPALVLTPPPEASEDNDGLLTASEIATLQLDADWVVLSACNTAAGSEVGAEALSGLARAFFFSGARALLVSHWAVYSDAAVKLTTEIFARMQDDTGIGRAEALRQSMLKQIAEGRQPGYWAPFVIVGEGGVNR